MRARNIKPGFFDNVKIGKTNPLSQILFLGLWCYADREGRFEWEPERIKVKVFPYRKVDLTARLEELVKLGFIVKYTVNNLTYGYIPTFLSHQKPHYKEKSSKIPPPSQSSVDDSSIIDQSSVNPDSLIVDRGLLNPDTRIEDKVSFGDFIEMTKKEHDTLVVKYGKFKIDKMIGVLDDYIGSSGKKYKSHYRTIGLSGESWVALKVLDRYPDRQTPAVNDKPICSKCKRFASMGQYDDGEEYCERCWPNKDKALETVGGALKKIGRGIS